MEKKEKVAFTMGLAVGIAIVSLAGALMMGFMFFNNSYSDNGKATMKDEKNNKVLNDGLIAAKKLDLAEEKINGVWTRGNKDAPVTLLEYSDYQCPYCARHHKTLFQIMEAYPDKVKWEYKHFPLDSIHPYSRKAAEAAECAGDQGKFWAFSDLLFANQKAINNKIYEKIAKRLNLKMKDFNSCFSSGKYKEKVSADLADGQSKGVRGTPGNFVNGVELRGAVPFEQMKTAIDKALNK